MASSNLDAKSARKEIEKFHLLLNHEAIIPAQCYRMSDNLYSLVCFTNQIVALYLSKNYQMIPVFIERVLKQLQRIESQPSVLGYRHLVYDYLCLMTYYLNQFCNLDEEWFSAHSAATYRCGGTNRPGVQSAKPAHKSTGTLADEPLTAIRQT